MVDPALAAMSQIIDSPKANDSAKVTAIRDILDRAGLGATQKIEVETNTRESTETLIDELAERRATSA